MVVIGAGLAGLAAACHLLGAGFEVTVFEREALPGGRAGRLERDGFAFDTGPTVFTMPHLLFEALAAAGGSPTTVPMRRLDPAYRACFADGSTLEVPADVGRLRAEVERICGAAEASQLPRFVEWLHALYELELPHFIDRNYDSMLDLVARPAALGQLARLGAFGRLDRAVGRFFTDDRLRRLFCFQALYAGLSPQRALALYAVITYMDTVAGVWAPEGGLHAVPVAMARTIHDAGAELCLGTAVTQVLRSPTGRVAGVQTADGTKLAADAVVCTLDPPTARRTVLAGLPGPRRPVRRPRFSPSAVVWHVGVRGVANSEVRHHNLHFGDQWKEAFGDLFDRGRLMRDPSRLVSVPSLDDPTLAPPGSSVLYVLEPVPNLDDGPIDWARERPRMRDRLLGFLERSGYPTDIVTDTIVTPREWAAQGMAAGTPFALAHTFTQTGPFRTPNQDRRTPGLFLAGSGTVPGVGIPMVLISGRLAAQRVQDYLT